MSLPKPYYQRGPVTLYHGDCLELLPHLPRVDAVVTDPPYGVDFHGKNTKHTKRYADGYSGGDSDSVGPKAIRWFVSVGIRCVVTPGIALAFDYPKPADIGAVYCPSGAGLGRWGFVGVHPILYYGKCPYLQNGMGHRPNSFSSFATADKNGHPCPKPEEWMEWLVRKASAFDGELIVDPFTGSGTTAIACIRNEKRFIGIERESEYLDIAAARCDRELDQKRLPFDAPKRTETQRALFAEVTA